MKTFLFYVLCVLSILGCSGSKKKVSISTAKDEILSIKETFSPDYKIINTEDISYKDNGVRVSRILYRITFPKGLSSTEIYDNFRYLTKKTYIEKGIRNISIFAYYPDDNMNSPYTIGMFEVDLAQDTKPNLVIADSYFKNESITIEKNDTIILETKEEYNKDTQKFQPAKRTKISNNPSDFTNCDYVPNGTEAKVVDVFRKRLTSDYTWISYKVYIEKLNKEVWVSDDCVKRND